MKITVFTDGSSLIKGEYYESSSAVIICVDGNRYYSVNYSCLSVIALQACKELHAIVKQQELRISTLEKQISELLKTNS